MTNDDIIREILINRVFLIVMLLGGGLSFAFMGFIAWLSMQRMRRPLGEFTLMAQLLLQYLKKQEPEKHPKPPKRLP